VEIAILDYYFNASLPDMTDPITHILNFHIVEELSTVENPILEKVRSGGSGQTFALQTKEKVSEQMEVAPPPTYASILKKGLKRAPVTVHSF
jgi:hypothetical protein